MFGDPYYHSITRRITTVFGTLFNEISIVLRDADGNPAQTIRVPIAYGPAEKWLARIRQESSVDNTVDGQTGVKMTLPRMTFQMTGLTYDETRQLNRNQKIAVCEDPMSEDFVADPAQTDFVVTLFSIDENTIVIIDGVVSTDFTINTETNTVILDNPAVGGEQITIKEGAKSFQYMRVPYNFEFDLNILTDKTEDGLKIIEQILPYFDNKLVVSVKMIPELGITEDIPFRIEAVNYDDNFEGDFEEHREIIWTINFTAESYLYKSTQEQKIILFAEDEIGSDPSTEDTPNSKLINLIVWEEGGYEPPNGG
jgi:hypothetical protein